MSILYLVATPIGNLEDISARALRTLGEVSLIAAEDTRHSGKLLAHFGIKTRMTSYFEHNKQKKIENVLAALGQGDVALISDAGTPGLNDPGYLLVRAALDAGHTVSPIPGPSAPIAALVSSGLPTDRFLYLGYLPRKGGDRRRVLQGMVNLPYTLIFLETPHRMDDALADILTTLGDRQIAVAGELTKMYEEIFHGSVNAACAHFKSHPARGEYTLVIAGASEDKAPWDESQVLTALRNELESGAPPSSVARKVAELSSWPRRKVYEMLTELQNEDD